MTEKQFITPLSQMFNDPFVREAFERAEREQGVAFAIVTQVRAEPNGEKRNG